MAVIGLGVGAAHARAYASHPRCAVRWLMDLDPKRAERLAAEVGGGVARSFEEALEDVEIVSIASYDDAHFEQAFAALRAGRHVFVEKPLCRSEEECRLLRRAWEEGGRPHLRSNLVLRAAPLYRRLRADVAAGRYGKVYAFDGEYLYGRLWKITEGWRKDVPSYSVMAGGGVHLLDLMTWCLDEWPSSVSAAANRIATEGTAFRYHDYVAATYRFPSGVVGRVTANFACVHPHRHVVRVFGTAATFVHDDAGARIHRARDPGGPPEIPPEAPLPRSKGDLVPSFVDAILSDADPAPGAEREFRLISLVAATDRAAREGREVEVIRPQEIGA